MTSSTKRVQTNREFAKTDTEFQRKCELAKVNPTKRQASKFRRGEGAAYRTLKSLS